MAEGGPDEDGGKLGPATPPGSHLTVKTEDSDRESSVGSPEPASTMGLDGTSGLFSSQQMHMSRVGAPDSNSNSIDPAKVAAAAAHLNGTMASMVTLQNFASLQNLPQVASLAAGLQGIAGLAGPQTPLNLSVSAQAASLPTTTSTSSASSVPTSISSLSHQHLQQLQHQQQQQQQQNNGQMQSQSINSILNNNNNNNSSKHLQHPHQHQQQSPPAAAAPTLPPPLLNAQQPAAMPQFILASGQLVHGIQGAQLLIPTSQGIATQTILTIPVNHVNSSDQMVNLALNNGQVVTTSLANLQAMAQPHHLLNSAANNVSLPTSTANLSSGLLNTAASLPHHLNGGSSPSAASVASAAQSLMSSLPQMLSAAAAASQQQQQQQPPQVPSVPLLSTVPLSNAPQTPQPPSTSPYAESKLHPQSFPRGATSSSATSSQSSAAAVSLNSINQRLSSINSEISITTSHGPPTSSQLPTIKSSPSNSSSVHQLSPNCNDNSNADMLDDCPNQPTINQTSSNVVDGINLDEIKEFAKAFKLRRLSLGLTQTQVGQALSITEGPAYSQSAICSALASQMYCAAQISSQQQAMFEKLDITPKSAQKIKPVLERWMKEAEERYKSGQNHLTDFIGVEPSKKRKRRTSFTPQALELLNAHFERNTHPSGTEITGLAHQLGYEREVIRIWFCNKRQALKNTVRMMSKGMV